MSQLIAKLDQFLDFRSWYGAVHSDADPFVLIHVMGWKEIRFQTKRTDEERTALCVQDVNDSIAVKP